MVNDPVLLREVVSTSISAAEALRRLGRDPRGTNYKALKRRLLQWGIDTEHWTSASKGLFQKGRERNIRTTIPLEQVLVECSTYSNSARLKIRLLRRGLLRNECYVCGILATWQDQPLSLQLDHLNGVHNDHRIENLRLLCPNCHSQTVTFCGRNKKPRTGMSAPGRS